MERSSEMTSKQIRRVQRLIRADKESTDPEYDDCRNDIKLTLIVGASGVQAVGRYNLKGTGNDIDEAISAAEKCLIERIESQTKQARVSLAKVFKREEAVKSELARKL